MRAKTVKRWLIFITVLSLIAGIGFFIQRFQVAKLARLVVKEADDALNKGDFAQAEKLYWEHLVLFPTDIVVKLKYADVILKVAQGDAEPVDLTGYVVEDAVKLIRGSKTT